MKKKLMILVVFSLVCCSISAQDCDLCGTWIYHYPGYYVDGEEIFPKGDSYLRIDEKNGDWYVSIKYGKDGQFWGYREATQVTLDKSGALTFNADYDNIVKHNDGTTSHCYTSYKAWIKGRTLLVKPVLECYWYDNYGRLKSHTTQDERPDAICVYHNEKDNW